MIRLKDLIVIHNNSNRSIGVILKGDNSPCKHNVASSIIQNALRPTNAVHAVTLKFRPLPSYITMCECHKWWRDVEKWRQRRPQACEDARCGWRRGRGARHLKVVRIPRVAVRCYRAYVAPPAPRPAAPRRAAPRLRPRRPVRPRPATPDRHHKLSRIY